MPNAEYRRAIMLVLLLLLIIDSLALIWITKSLRLIRDLQKSRENWTGSRRSIRRRDSTAIAGRRVGSGASNSATALDELHNNSTGSLRAWGKAGLT
jgi:hypothetical protein